MDTLTVIGSIAGFLAYLAAGIVYARSQAVACYKRAKKAWGYESIYMDSVQLMMAWRVFAWPYAAILDAIRGPLAAWLMAPLTDRKARAQQARDDAERWYGLAKTGTPAEQAMAPELARICTELAESLEL